MSLISNLSKTAKIMIVSVIAVCFILLIAGLIVLNLLDYYNVLGKIEIEKSLPYAMGLALGGISSIVKIILIEKSFNRAVQTENEKQAANMGQLFYIGRILLSFAVLLVGFLVKFFGFLGTFMGIFSLRIAAYVTTIVESKDKKNDNNYINYDNEDNEDNDNNDKDDKDDKDDKIENNVNNESKER